MHLARRLALGLLAGLTLVVGADASVARERASRSERHEAARVARHPRPSKRRAVHAAAAERRARRGEEVRAGASIPSRPRAGAPLSILSAAIRCPDDMVAVAGRVCVDRYETSLVDRATGRPWSPFYAPSPERAREAATFYDALRAKAAPTSLDAATPIPEPPTFAIEPRAVPLASAIPQGYLSADVAEEACRASGKRLCTEPEWLTACRGDGETAFPYGERYEQGACNVYRESHPSFLLHGVASRYHDDPRNNLVAFEGRPLLRKTGETPRCASRWGDDAIYDMVGNLDEWVADAGGVFVGGFYARGTKSGCFSRVSNHPRGYSDYSTGARCCADPLP